MYTYTFRELVRVAAKMSDVHIEQIWTDKKKSPVTGEERIVTVSSNDIGNKRLVPQLERLMELVGINPQSHGLRVTDSGYVKCDCTLPGFIKFNQEK